MDENAVLQFFVSMVDYFIKIVIYLNIKKEYSYQIYSNTVDSNIFYVFNLFHLFEYITVDWMLIPQLID